MGWMHLVESLVKSLAWPLVALTLGLFFRQEISALIARLRGIKLPGGGEAQFAPELDEAEALADQAVQGLSPEAAERRSEAPSASQAESDEAEEDQAELITDPTSSVIRAWVSLERTVLELRRQQSNIVGRTPVRVDVALQQLLKTRVVNTAFAEAVTALQRLSTSVAHGQEAPSVASARNYVKTARDLQRTAEALLPSESER
jgi:hypothetical protein